MFTLEKCITTITFRSSFSPYLNQYSSNYLPPTRSPSITKFKSTLSLFTLTLLTLSSAQQTSKIGYTGVLSSLDSGLGGTIAVKDANTLVIIFYTLKGVSAPAP